MFNITVSFLPAFINQRGRFLSKILKNISVHVIFMFKKYNVTYGKKTKQDMTLINIRHLGDVNKGE